MKCNKSSKQQLIRYTGYKSWNDLPEKMKTKLFLTYTSLQFHSKKVLIETQI